MKVMQAVLFGVAIVAFFLTIACAVFVDANHSTTSGGGFSIPFWPFVLLLALVMLILAILLPRLADLIALWLKTRVEIAKAENSVEEPKSVEPPKPEGPSAGGG